MINYIQNYMKKTIKMKKLMMKIIMIIKINNITLNNWILKIILKINN